MNFETAQVIDIGDNLVLGALESGEKIWLSGPAVPGDLVEFQREGKQGRVVSIPAPAPHRVPPPCPHFHECPGCSLQPLPYETQVELKASKISETLRRLGGFTAHEWRGVRPAPSPLGYRNKLDLHVRENQIGYLAGRDLVPITHCLLGDSLLRDTLAAIRPAFDDPHGIHRILLRADSPRARVSVLVTGHPLPATLETLCRALPAVSTLFRRSETGKPWLPIFGNGALDLTLAHHTHRVRLDAFFQVNEAVADALVRTAMDWLAEQPAESLLDLFSGCGAFTLPATRIVPRVLGIDNTPGEGPFLSANLAKGLPNDPRVTRKKWDVVLLDPPRAGAEKRLTQQIRDDLRPDRILYVSCNPATLARDLARLCQDGAYTLQRAEGFDLFPQTPHVETLALLSRNCRSTR